jgi:chromosome segregation ATPase
MSRWKKCSVPGCLRPAKAKSLCAAHYSRLKHGLRQLQPEVPVRSLAGRNEGTQAEATDEIERLEQLVAEKNTELAAMAKLLMLFKQDLGEKNAEIERLKQFPHTPLIAPGCPRIDF